LVTEIGEEECRLHLLFRLHAFIVIDHCFFNKKNTFRNGNYKNILASLAQVDAPIRPYVSTFYCKKSVVDTWEKYFDGFMAHGNFTAYITVTCQYVFHPWSCFEMPMPKGHVH
jgi:hypothetical protein